MLERHGPTETRLRLSYRVPTLGVRLTDQLPGTLAQAIAELCDTEINETRTALGGIGEALGSQLSDQGRKPHVDQRFRDFDERGWCHKEGSFTIAASVYDNETILLGYEGASDAALVRGTIDNLIRQRELSIRKLYQQILSDATAKRNGQEHARHGSSRPGKPARGHGNAKLPIWSPGGAVDGRRSPSLN